MRFTARSVNNWLRITIRPVIFEVGSYYHSVLAVFLLQTSLWRYFGCSCFTICGSYCTLILMGFAAPHPPPNYSFWLLHVLMCFEYWLRLYSPQVSASNSISMWWLSSFPDVLIFISSTCWISSRVDQICIPHTVLNGWGAHMWMEHGQTHRGGWSCR